MKNCKICEKKIGKNKQKYCSFECAYKGKRSNDNASWKKRYYPNKYSEKYKKYYKDNPHIYLKVLRQQAIRKKELGIDDLRREEIREIHEKLLSVNRGLPPRKWEDSEIEYLEENYLEKQNKEMALYLGRSWSSVCHKLERLGLVYNNKWN